MPATFSFNAVSHVQVKVDCLFDNFVVNDVPLLQRCGRFFLALVLMIARLVSSFNWLEDTFGPDHVLVQLILQKWKTLNTRNERVPRMRLDDRGHEILRRWSQLIQDNFDNAMSRRKKSTGPVDEQKRIDQSTSELAAAVNKLNNSAQLMEENRLLREQVMIDHPPQEIPTKPCLDAPMHTEAEENK